MKAIKRVLLPVLVLMTALLLTACGNPQVVEIRNLELSEDKQFLSIVYVAKGNVPAGEGSFRISVSGGDGEVYGISEVDKELIPGHQHILMFEMRTSLTGTQRVWQVGKPFLLPDGTQAADTVATEDVLALFGDSASITVEFRIGDKTVAEAKLKP